jgi:hypothetical protein
LRVSRASGKFWPKGIRMIKSVPSRLFCGIFCFGLALFATQNVSAAERGGGSNYLWYDADDTCKFADHPIVGDYKKQKQVIDKQLAALHANGQRRLRVGYAVTPNTNKMNSSGTDLDPGYKANLTSFLKSVKNAGFEEVEFMNGAAGESPHKWKEWQEDEYLRIWYKIAGERQALMQSGLHYLIDLFNEAIPASNQHILLQFSQRLWSDYVRMLGKKDTVGFSIIPDIKQNRFAQMRSIYGNNPPDVFDLHIYADSYDKFVNAHQQIAAQGYGNTPWIIGEALYNDAQEADELDQAIKATGQRVLWLTQWQKTRGSKCPVNVVPLDFNNYRSRGF